jgi:Peptidase A4 family
MIRNARMLVVIAAGALITTSLATSAAATAAATGHSAAAVQKSKSFAGYEVSKPTAHVNRATVTFVVPTITCKKNFSGVGPSLSVQTTPNKQDVFTDDIAAVGVGCENKQPAYESIIQIDGHSFNDLPFAANDKVKVALTVVKARTTVTVDDLTSGAHKTRTGAGRTGAIAFFGDLGLIINNKKTGLDSFSKTSFTDGMVNGKTLAAEGAKPFEWTHGKTVKVAVSKLSKGKDFDLTFKHS